MYWPRLKESLDNLPPPDERLVQKRDPQEVLEEILSIVRGLATDQSAPSRDEEQARLAAFSAAFDNMVDSWSERDPQGKVRRQYVLRGFKPRSALDNKEAGTPEDGNEE